MKIKSFISFVRRQMKRLWLGHVMRKREKYTSRAVPNCKPMGKRLWGERQCLDILEENLDRMRKQECREVLWNREK